MTLPLQNLDDRTFQQLVDEAKRRIPEHCPQWTNHNVADPGVALIELFAWMTEISLYRLNQVPDVFYTEMLNLVGMSPFPAAAARTDLLFRLVAPVRETVVVGKGTEVGTPGESSTSVVFTTLEPVTISPPELDIALYSPARLAADDRSVVGKPTEPGDTFVDLWHSLRSPLRSTALFQRNPVVPHDCFYLGFGKPLGGIAIRIEISADKQGRGVIPDDPPLVWEAWTGKEWEACGKLSDDTGGLNRPGNIELLVPRHHTDLDLGNDRKYWIRARLTEPQEGQRPYQESPEVRHLQVYAVGGTALAQHCEVHTGELLGVSSGDANQVFRVQHRPVLTPRLPEETIEVAGWPADRPWTEVEHLGESDADEPHFTWDSTSGEVRFGVRIRYPDGTIKPHGTPPPAGARITMKTYRSGGGAIGNVGANALTRLRTTIEFVQGVTNPNPATGGVDAETVDNVKLRAPLTLRAGWRAVTVADFERLAKEADPFVGRVRAVAPEEPGAPVRLLIVPALTTKPNLRSVDDLRVPKSTADRVKAHLDERRLLGTQVLLRTPYYQGVTVAARLVPNLGTDDRTQVRDRCLDALYRYLDPVPCNGRPGWPYGEHLSVEAVRQVLESVEGVGDVLEVLLYDYDPVTKRRTGPKREFIQLAADHLFFSHKHQVVVREKR